MIKSGVIKNTSGLVKACKDLPDGQYLFTVEPFNTRTDKMNNYLHVTIRWFKKEMADLGNNWTEPQAKRWLKKLIGWGEWSEIKTSGGVERDFVEWKTRDISDKKFTLLIKLIREWCIDHLGYEPPPPKYKWDDK